MTTTARAALVNEKIPTRPSVDDYEVMEKAAVELAQKITRWDDPFTRETMATLILDAYQHNFLNNGYQIYEHVKETGGIVLDDERQQLFDLIENIAERISLEDEKAWYEQYKELLPAPLAASTAVSFKGRTGVILGLSEDQPGAYQVALHGSENENGEKQQVISVPFELLN